MLFNSSLSGYRLSPETAVKVHVNDSVHDGTKVLATCNLNPKELFWLRGAGTSLSQRC